MEEKLKKQVTIMEIAVIIVGFLMVLEVVLLGCMIRRDSCSGGGLQPRVDAHNRQWLQYQGTQIGASVKILISTVEQYNISGAEDESEYILVKMDTDVSKEINPSNGALTGQSGIDFNKNFEAAKSQVRVGARYNITFAYAENTGYIVEIGIQEVQSFN